MSQPINRFGVAISALLLAISIVTADARGQVYGERQRQPEVKLEPLQCSGTVKQIGRGLIQLATAEGEQWLIQVEAKPQDIAFSGSADVSFLKPGMWVQFSTRLSKRGQAPEPISSLTIFTPVEGTSVGVSSESSFGVGGGAAAALFGDEKPEEKPKPRQKEDENTVYRVAGQITKISRTGELTVNARGQTVKADLAEDAKVSVATNDLSWLRVGDAIEVQGDYVMGQKGRGRANKVTASTTEPLTGAKKKTKAAPSTSEKPEAEKPEPEKPAEDKAADEKKAAEVKP